MHGFLVAIMGLPFASFTSSPWALSKGPFSTPQGTRLPDEELVPEEEVLVEVLPLEEFVPGGVAGEPGGGVEVVGIRIVLLTKTVVAGDGPFNVTPYGLPEVSPETGIVMDVLLLI